MNREDEPRLTDQHTAALRRTAQDPDRYAQYLADVARMLLGISRDLETLQGETRVHCRSAHVNGDRWYHARRRARPTEKTLKRVLKHLQNLVAELEKSVRKRHEFEHEMKALPRRRRERELARERKRNPGLRAAPARAALENPANKEQNPRYSGPTDIYSLPKRGTG
ncbi:hypothetical protein ACFZBU_39730 [Embleya sp. NPDC008237]|uniref:hypothetical protein n=1 Tax=Embleya sp. NPDC008237 TaxID=3363978 RepID=UPI0036F099B8